MTPELKSLCDRLEGYTPCLQPDICIADRHTVDEAAAKLREMAGEIERIKRPNLFWIDEDPETGYCDPWEATESALYSCGDEGVAAIREGRELGIRYYARLRPDDEIGIEDDWLKDFATEAEADAAIAAERARRAALGGSHG